MNRPGLCPAALPARQGSEQPVQHIIFFLLLVALCAQPAEAQRGEARFEHLSIDQGLSQTTVFSIFQDSRGFLWFGTLDGLNRYDGYTFTVYRSTPRDPQTLSNNSVFKIFEDRDGALWIGTLGGGLNVFDRGTERFRRFRSNPNDSASLSNDFVRSIFQDRAGRVWIGTNNGLNRYNPATGTFVRYGRSQSIPAGLSNNTIWAIYESPSEPGILWIGTYEGLNRFNTATGAVTVYRNDPGSPRSLSNNYVWSILEGSDSTLWIGTNAGLNLFNKRSGAFTRFVASPSDPRTIGHNNVWALCRDAAGSLVIGTLGGGLNILTPGTATGRTGVTVARYEHDAANPGSLSQNFVWSLCLDNTGILWIGTDGGLNKLDPSREKFARFSANPFTPGSISNAEVTSILRTRAGVLWVGTKDGLNRYDETRRGFVHYRNRAADPYSLGSNFVRSLYEDRHGRLWVGTSGGGLNRWLPDRGGFLRMQAGQLPHGLSSNDCTSLVEDGSGAYWIGTLSGLNLYNPAKGVIAVYQHNDADTTSLSHDYISTMARSRDGTLWIGTFGGGLNAFDPVRKQFTRWMDRPGDTAGIGDNNIWCIHEDSTGALWIGTNNGLARFDRASGTFAHYDESSGLVNNVVYGILEDRRGNLWLSSNKGLSVFNPRTGAVRTYGTSDGLQSPQFGGNAYFRDAAGTMYFGGIKGFNAFCPDSIRDNPHVPPIVITGFQIFNKPVPIGDGSPLRRAVGETNNIELSYGQNVFSFEFAALHYAFPEANQYAYKMEGFDADWIRSGTRRFATYTNLDPGRYVFRVIGSNNDGVWNLQGAAITVLIAPPFWKTWWFIVGVVLLVLSIVASIAYFRFRHLLAIERLRVKISSDLHDEIGTRLTEISLLSDMVCHIEPDNPAVQRDSVRNIGDIARSLIESMSDIVWLINPERDSLYELFLKLKDTYEEILSYKQINVRINNLESLKNITLPMDYRKNIYLIYKEAINNTIKYSGCSEISINTDVRGSTLSITMYDNGCGFDPQQPRTSNGLDDMELRARECGGRLRIQSKPGEGTMIRYTGRI